MGPNGCGKSTLLNILAGVSKQDSGTIEVAPNKNNTLQVGYVWQDYRSSLLPWYNVAENVTFPLKIKGVSKQQRYETASELFKKLGINIDLYKKTYELSGGQQQLLNIVRNMVIKPDLLLLDEPFSALDQYKSWSMAFQFEELWLDLKIPVLFVSHDVDEAIFLADEIILINKSGQIEKKIKNGLPHKRTKEMLATKTHIDCRNEIIEFLFSQNNLHGAVEA